MNEGSLLSRLAHIKKELSSLKIAHRRGLGLINLHSATIDVDTSQASGFFRIVVTINLDRDSSPFGLLSVCTDYVPGTLYFNGTLSGFSYSADGYTITASFYALPRQSSPYRHIRVVCTSKIASVSGRVEDA